VTVDADIWRAARLLIKQHGENAQIVSLERHAQMLMRQDFDGAEMWSQIGEAVKELQMPPLGRAH